MHPYDVLLVRTSKFELEQRLIVQDNRINSESRARVRCLADKIATEPLPFHANRVPQYDRTPVSKTRSNSLPSHEPNRVPNVTPNRIPNDVLNSVCGPKRQRPSLVPSLTAKGPEVDEGRKKKSKFSDDITRYLNVSTIVLATPLSNKISSTGYLTTSNIHILQLRREHEFKKQQS